MELLRLPPHEDILPLKARLKDSKGTKRIPATAQRPYKIC